MTQTRGTPSGRKTENRRALIIGLDGATFRLIEPLSRAGKLPHLTRLMDQGAWGTLRSTIQPSSEQAWATFMTGQNNGKHGVFGFQQRRPGTYHFDYVNGRSIRARTLWRLLSDRGRQVVVVNVPMTYPPEPVNGVLVGGLLSPGEQSAFTYPAGVYEELCSVCGDYRISVDIERGRLDDAQLHQLAEDALRMIRLRTCAALHLAETRPWDLFMVMFEASDRLAHKFWKYWDPNHPLYTQEGAARFGHVLPQLYEALDAAVGELLDALQDDDVTVFILSDHGFGPMEKAVYLNRWLAQKGRLHLRKTTLSPKEQARLLLRGGVRQAQRLLNVPIVAQAKKWAFQRFPWLKGSLYSSVAFAQVDWSRTRAYALGTMGNIYLNLQGREPEGIVAPGPEADALVEELVHELADLRDPETNEPVFFQVHRGRDLYQGPFAHLGPDVVGVKTSRYHVVTADWLDGTEIVASLGDAMHFASDQSGQHELDGVLFAAGPEIRRGSHLPQAHLVDMAASILYALGEPIPADMDSRVILDLFTPEALQDRPPIYAEEEPSTVSRPDQAYTPEEEELLHKHLAGLGYLD